MCVRSGGSQFKIDYSKLVLRFFSSYLSMYKYSSCIRCFLILFDEFDLNFLLFFAMVSVHVILNAQLNKNTLVYSGTFFKMNYN